MPAPTSDLVRGIIRLDNLPDACCFTGWQDFLSRLPSMLAVEIPVTVGHVVVSVSEPGVDDYTKLWVRLDGSGSFIGIFMFMAGAWQQVLPAPNGIFRMYGDSRAVPAGYLLADAANPHLTGSEAAALTGTWVHDPSGTYYTVFDVTYEGF